MFKLNLIRVLLEAILRIYIRNYFDLNHVFNYVKCDLPLDVRIELNSAEKIMIHVTKSIRIVTV